MSNVCQATTSLQANPKESELLKKVGTYIEFGSFSRKTKKSHFRLVAKMEMFQFTSK